MVKVNHSFREALIAQVLTQVTEWAERNRMNMDTVDMLRVHWEKDAGIVEMMTSLNNWKRINELQRFAFAREARKWDIINGKAS